MAVVEDVPTKAADELYPHQKEAVERYKDSSEIGLGWTMGVGKSAAILRIASYKFEKGDIDSLLIVAPNQVHVQWARQQCPLWLTVPYELQCFGGAGGAKQTYPFTEDNMLHVVCVNIDTFSTPSKWKDIADWVNATKCMVVLDEASTIKTHNSQRTQRMLYAFNDVIRRGKAVLASTPRTVARAALTGTIVTNGPLDLWSIMEFIRPNFFNRNWYSFKSYYGMYTKIEVNGRAIDIPLTEEWWKTIRNCMSYEEAAAICGCSRDTFDTVHSQLDYQGPYKHAEELKEKIAEIFCFKKLEECVEMPATNYISKVLDMPCELNAVYESMVEELIAVYAGAVMTAQSKMTALIRLQQISSGFVVNTVEAPTPEDTDAVMMMFEDEDVDFIPGQITWIGKSNPKLDAIYRDVDEAEKPIIIITRFTAEADRIYNDLCEKYNCCMVTGWKKVGTIEDFQAGKYQIMIANIAAVSRGFNLQNSCLMLFYSNTFSLEHRLQCEGRIFRIGQERPCTYVDYIYDKSIDEKVIESLRMKRNLLDFISSATIEELIT
jgi:hypothetical protein